MIKMYLAEVLGKLPVIQHFLFGSLLSYDGPMPPESEETDDAHWGHAHTQNAKGGKDFGWGDCCGIPVPSAFGAAAAQDRTPMPRLEGPKIKPVPFD